MLVLSIYENIIIEHVFCISTQIHGGIFIVRLDVCPIGLLYVVFYIVLVYLLVHYHEI